MKLSYLYFTKQYLPELNFTFLNKNSYFVLHVFSLSTKGHSIPNYNHPRTYWVGLLLILLFYQKAVFIVVHHFQTRLLQSIFLINYVVEALFNLLIMDQRTSSLIYMLISQLLCVAICVDFNTDFLFLFTFFPLNFESFKVLYLIYINAFMMGKLI